MSNLIETRALPGSAAAVRANGTGRTVTGYAIVFNRLSEDLGGFREMILPEAITGVIEKSDIFALLNHNMDRGILARATNGKGSLTLTTDNKGVRYSFEAPNFSLGEELLENIRRGQLYGSSFAFNCGPDDDSFERDSVGGYIRVIKRFQRLHDVSCVYSPAYKSTSVNIERSLATSQTTTEYKQHIELLRKHHNAMTQYQKQLLK